MRPYDAKSPTDVADPAIRDHLTRHHDALLQLARGMSKVSKGLVPTGGSAPIFEADHGALLGLDDDDHAQYLHLPGRATTQIIGWANASGSSVILTRAASPTAGSYFLRCMDSALTTTYGGITNEGYGRFTTQVSVLPPSNLSSSVLGFDSLQFTNSVGSANAHIYGTGLHLGGGSYSQIALSFDTCKSVFNSAGVAATTDNLVRILGSASQTGDLLRFETSTATLLSRVKADGTWDGPITATSLPANVALLDTAQTFTAANIFRPATDAVPLAIDGANVSSANLFTIKRSDAEFVQTIDSAGGVNFLASFSVWSGSIGTSNSATFDASAVSTACTITIPSIDGTLVLTSGTQTLNGNKTLSGTTTMSGLSSVLAVASDTSGVAFRSTTGTNRKATMNTAGCSDSTWSTLKFASTASRTFTFPNYSGNVPVASDTPGAYEVLSTGASGQELWQSIDNNHIANRTRTAWYSVGAFYDPSTGGGGFDGTVGSAPASLATYHTLPAVGGSPIVGYIHVPSDYASGATWKLYWTTTSTDLNTVSAQVALHVIGSGTILDATATSSVTTNLTPSGTAKQVVITTLSNSLTVAAGDVVRVCIQRDSADSNGDGALVLGMMLQYTADM